MRTKADELITHLLWAVDMLCKPTFRNLTDSYESWAYRNGFKDQIRSLRRRGFIERQSNRRNAGIRLTEKGRIHALGGRDPVLEWNVPFDGQWCVVSFDIPQVNERVRVRINRRLGALHFGRMQKSAWVRPAFPVNQLEGLCKEAAGVERLIIWETARPWKGHSDISIVQAAWDFNDINRHYEEYIAVTNAFPGAEKIDPRHPARLARWSAHERIAWNLAVSRDPLLPRTLWPPGYLGEKAYRLRQRVLAKAGKAAARCRIKK